MNGILKPLRASSQRSRSKDVPRGPSPVTSRSSRAADAPAAFACCLRSTSTSRAPGRERPSSHPTAFRVCTGSRGRSRRSCSSTDGLRESGRTSATATRSGSRSSRSRRSARRCGRSCPARSSGWLRSWAARPSSRSPHESRRRRRAIGGLAAAYRLEQPAHADHYPKNNPDQGGVYARECLTVRPGRRHEIPRRAGHPPGSTRLR
jgi:hypothetical protein